MPVGSGESLRMVTAFSLQFTEEWCYLLTLVDESTNTLLIQYMEITFELPFKERMRPNALIELFVQPQGEPNKPRFSELVKSDWITTIDDDATLRHVEAEKADIRRVSATWILDSTREGWRLDLERSMRQLAPLMTRDCEVELLVEFTEELKVQGAAIRTIAKAEDIVRETFCQAVKNTHGGYMRMRPAHKYLWCLDREVWVWYWEPDEVPDGCY